MNDSILTKPIIGKKTDTIFFILLTLLYVSFYLPMGSTIPTVALLVYYIFYNRFTIKFKVTFFVVYGILFVAFCYFTCLWATDTYYVLLYSNHILKTMLGIFVIYACMQNKLTIRVMLKAMIWGGYIMMGYMIAFYGINELINMLNEAERLTNEVMNANNFAMCISYTCVAHIFFGIKERWSITHFLMIPAALLLAVSGSRKGLIILIGGVICLAVFSIWQKEHSLKSIFKIFFWMLLLVVGFFVLLNLSAFQFIKERMMNFFMLLAGDTNVDNSLISRSNFIEIGIAVFKDNPILGVGIDNARLYNYRNVYLHNNFVEMLADGGLFGFCLYYSLYIYLFVGYIKNRKTTNKYYSICFVLLSFMTAMHYAFVAYKVSGEYYMLLLCFLQLQQLKSDSLNKEKKT